jgi:hypothetical protein
MKFKITKEEFNSLLDFTKNHIKIGLKFYDSGYTLFEITRLNKKGAFDCIRSENNEEYNNINIIFGWKLAIKPTRLTKVLFSI